MMTWEISSLDQLGLLAKATAVAGQAGRLYYSEAGTLFLSRQGENVAVWNPGDLGRIWVLTFRTDCNRVRGLSEILERPPENRIIKLSSDQQQLVCDNFQRIASESSHDSSPGADAPSPWLTIQLVTVMRWFVETRNEDLEANPDADRQCFELWVKIHQHANQNTSAEPMLFYKDVSYDSFRHRFQKVFGVSPRGMLVRLRMNRAKELLGTADISIKEVARELGYTKQHEFTRAFTRFFGESPSTWRKRALPQLKRLERGLIRTNL
jgi:hypothetical protein